LTDRGRATTTFSTEQINDLIKRVQTETKVATPPSGSKSSTETTSASKPELLIDEENESPTALGGTYRDQTIEMLKALSPGGFERFCQRLLREAGFQQVRVTGRSGDGGIDGIGILQVNPFVSFKVLFQSKRYSGSVSPAQVRDFRGAMMGRADKGLILTTGSFTPDAKLEAARDGVPPIELVDGQGLIDLLEQLEIGLKPRQTFELDKDFFEDFK
jgi:restriction system protein